MKKLLLVTAASLALAIPMFALSPAADAAGKSAKQRGARGELVHQIVMNWGNHVQEAYQADVGRWARDMGPVFAKASLESLTHAAAARSFDAMNESLLRDNVGVGVQERMISAMNDGSLARPPIKAALLGEVTNDLVFVPITPCRILDTRVAGGQIGAGTVRGVDVTAVSSYGFQGGVNNDCSGAGAAGNFAAVAINFTIVSPQGTTPGNMTAYPVGTTMPTSSSLNFKPGDIVGNLGIFKLDQGAAANELNVYSTHTTHLVGDMVGYFINPQLGPLDCEEKETAQISIGAGGVASSSTAACSAGYTVVSGGCTSSTFDGRIVSNRTFSASNNHFCAFRNEGAGTMQGVVYSRCCRLPVGR